MVRVVSSKTVNLPHERVFSAIKEIGKLPTLFPDKYKSFKKDKDDLNKYIAKKFKMEIDDVDGKEQQSWVLINPRSL